MAKEVTHLGCDINRSFSNPSEYSYLLVWQRIIGANCVNLNELIGEYNQADADEMAEIIRWLACVGGAILRQDADELAKSPGYDRSDVFGQLFYKFNTCREIGQRHGMTRLEFVLHSMKPAFRERIEQGLPEDFKPVPATHRQLQVAAALFRWLGTDDGEQFLKLAHAMSTEQRILQDKLYRILVYGRDEDLATR